MTTSYDSSIATDPHVWQSTPPQERLRQIRNFYLNTYGPANKLHLLLHLNVETKIALGHGPTVKAMTRLANRGLTRHQALTTIAHAIWDVMASEQRLNAVINQL